MAVTASETGQLNWKIRVKGFVALTKPRIIELLLVTTLPTMVVAQRGWPSFALVLETLVGGSLAAGGANTFNMVIDRDIDAIMDRTKKRPLVTGAVTARQALIFALVLELAAFFELWYFVNLLSAIFAVSATLFYVFIYTLWLKRRSVQNIVIGGAAGAVPVLVGWSAVTNSIAWTPLVMFAIIFIWTPPHFWALAVKYRDDYEAANVPMLPVVASPERTTLEILVYSIVLVATTFLLGPVASLGWIYALSSLLFGALFITMAWKLWREALRGEMTTASAMKLFHYSISYLTLLFVAMALDVLVLG
ncbi:MAG: heme o synthase [Actinobacteria bacterium]|nr:heme o synthase [Actinomycetota bacterium]